MVKSIVYLISIILIIASLSTPSHGLEILGYSISRVIIDGVVYCNLTGEPNPVSNAPVYLVCGGPSSTFTLADTLTDRNGLFRIVLTYLETILFNPNFCGLGFTISPATCAIGTPDAALIAPLKLVEVIHNNTINTALYAVSLFINTSR
ncbi:hypothetical protein DY000_02011990 [Brassica cretica]|uniref:Uncharacterized protein n=1 Tax=Brassica cretica TaxID=69181 RepID=A0ABQ7CZ11_BRACR|nr:hypothetical protein DY000_02011990 [Brassica cretica]